MKYERLFLNHVTLTLEEISDTINEIFDNNFEEYEEKDAIKKWNSFPVIFLESDEVKKKFLKMVVYIDELYLDSAKKVSLITSLAGMIELSKIPITELDDGNLFTLLTYLETIKLDSIEDELVIFNNPNLLNEIRKKSIDMTERIFIMNYVDELAIVNITDIGNKNEIANFVNKIVPFLANCSHDELMDKSGFEDYVDKLEALKKEKEKEEDNKKE